MSTISFSWSAMTSLTSGNPGTVPGGGSTPAPSALDPNVFLAWSIEKQVDYLRGNAPIPATGLKIGPPGGETITARLASSETLRIVAKGVNARDADTRIEPPAARRKADRAAEFVIPADLAPERFLEWEKADQLAYVETYKGAMSGGVLTIGADSFAGRIAVEKYPDVEVTGAVIRSVGDQADIPYHQLPGGTAGSRSPFNTAKAQAFFPEIDGEDNVLTISERPAGFYKDPASFPNTAAGNAAREAFLEDFGTWHSGYQLEYVKTWGQDTDGNGVGDRLVINKNPAPTDPSETTNLFTALVSKEDGNRLNILSSLDKAGFARLSLDDQKAMAATAGFAETAARLQLATAALATIENVNSTATPKEKLTPALAVDQYIKYVEDARTTNISPAKAMDAADQAPFLAQLKLLKEQIGTMGVIAPADIVKRLTELKDRFDRAFAFFDVKPPTARTDAVYMGVPARDALVYDNVVTADGSLAGIQKGYRIFIDQEKKLAAIAEERMSIVRDRGAPLDAPTLVYRFQSLYNLQLEARVVMDTEEVNQQNDLLKTYSRMQDIINRTLGTFKKADDGESTILGKHVDALDKNLTDVSQGAFTAEERYVLSMFEDQVGKGQRHPLERLRNISRPLDEIFLQFGTTGDKKNDNYNLASRSHTQWSTFGTRLTEAVTIVNQNSQIAMNDINSLDKQRNRHFELANSALSKMNEMINNIARSG